MVYFIVSLCSKKRLCRSRQPNDIPSLSFFKLLRLWDMLFLVFVFEITLCGVLFINHEDYVLKSSCGTTEIRNMTYHYKILTQKNGVLKKLQCEEYCKKCSKVYKSQAAVNFGGIRDTNIIDEFSTLDAVLNYAGASTRMNVDIGHVETATVHFGSSEACKNSDFKESTKILYDYHFASGFLVKEACIHIQNKGSYGRCDCGKDKKIRCSHYASTDCSGDSIGTSGFCEEDDPFQWYCGHLDITDDVTDSDYTGDLEGDRGALRIQKKAIYLWNNVKKLSVEIDDNASLEEMDYRCEQRVVRKDDVLIKSGCVGMDCKNCEKEQKIRITSEIESVDTEGYFPLRLLRRQIDVDHPIPITEGDVVRIGFSNLDEREIGDVRYYHQLYELVTSREFCAWGEVNLRCIKNVLYAYEFELKGCRGPIKKRTLFRDFIGDSMDHQYFCGPIYKFDEIIKRDR